MGGNSRGGISAFKQEKLVFESNKKIGYNTKIFDPKHESFLDINKNKVDIIFNALHGEEGRWICAKFF